MIYGRQPVLELLKAGRRHVRELLLADGMKPSAELNAIEAQCLERSISIRRFDREVFDAWLNAANHQGVITVCDEFPYTDFDEIFEALRTAEGNAMIVLLDHVVDPQNLGSLMRSCEAAGVLGVVLPADRAVGVTPASVRASAGAAEHLRVAIVPSLVSTLEQLKDKESGVWITGLEVSEDAKPYTEIDFKGKVALVIGSEGQGLSASVRGKCDFLAKLPMCGKVGSLNAGVAGALAMYEVLRQHGKK
jgi:23S rRNA (guanosine2251-2'-O)-methyltransferase